MRLRKNKTKKQAKKYAKKYAKLKAVKGGVKASGRTLKRLPVIAGLGAIGYAVAKKARGGGDDAGSYQGGVSPDAAPAGAPPPPAATSVPPTPVATPPADESAKSLSGELPSDPVQDVEAPNESAPGHHPTEGEKP